MNELVNIFTINVEMIYISVSNTKSDNFKIWMINKCCLDAAVL